MKPEISPSPFAVRFPRFCLCPLPRFIPRQSWQHKTPSQRRVAHRPVKHGPSTKRQGENAWVWVATAPDKKKFKTGDQVPPGFWQPVSSQREACSVGPCPIRKQSGSLPKRFFFPALPSAAPPIFLFFFPRPTPLKSSRGFSNPFPQNSQNLSITFVLPFSF